MRGLGRLMALLSYIVRLLIGTYLHALFPDNCAIEFQEKPHKKVVKRSKIKTENEYVI